MMDMLEMVYVWEYVKDVIYTGYVKDGMVYIWDYMILEKFNFF